MHAGRGLARHAGLAAIDTIDAAALDVVEDEDAAGAEDVGNKALGLGIVDLAHLVIVPEIADRTALLDEGETLRVEPDLVRNRPHIVDMHPVRLMHHVRRRVAGTRLIGVIARPLRHRHDVVQFGFDIRQTIGGAHRGAPPGLLEINRIRGLAHYSFQNGLSLSRNASARVMPISFSMRSSRRPS